MQRQPSHHQAHRSRIGLLARKRQRTTIEEVDHRRVTQRGTVDTEIGVFILLQFGNGRRNEGHGWHQQRVKFFHCRGHSPLPIGTLHPQLLQILLIEQLAATNT
ncbi:hypothetical protein D3C71_1924950 [compost metagenome]